MFTVSVDNFRFIGKVILIEKRWTLAKVQSYPSTQVSVHWFIPFTFCANSPQGSFDYYKYVAQRYAG